MTHNNEPNGPAFVKWWAIHGKEQFERWYGLYGHEEMKYTQEELEDVYSILWFIPYQAASVFTFASCDYLPNMSLIQGVPPLHNAVASLWDIQGDSIAQD